MARKITNATKIIKDYFGTLPGQKLADFTSEIRALKEDPEAYEWVVIEAARELGIEPKYEDTAA